MQTVLYVLAEVIRCLGLITQPFMPDSAAKLLNQLKIDDAARNFESINEQNALQAVWSPLECWMCITGTRVQ